MDVEAHLDAPVPPAELFGWLDDLAAYPRWMPLVHHVEPLGDDDGRPVWLVEIRRRIGPLARSKRLRMVRALVVPDQQVRFERVETDGRSHSPWVLEATLHPSGDPGGGTRLAIRLHYGGTLWTGGLLERALAEDISTAREQLLRLVSAPPTR